MGPIVFESRVNAKGTMVKFVCHAYCAVEPNEQLIEPEFYNKFNGIPQGLHFEMEVIEPAEKPAGVPIHIHVNPHTQRRFVCWFNEVPTQQNAWNLFIAWSVGTAYTLISGLDFAPLMKPFLAEFLTLMEQQHGVKLEWTNMEGEHI